MLPVAQVVQFRDVVGSLPIEVTAVVSGVMDADVLLRLRLRSSHIVSPLASIAATAATHASMIE
jgi:hypothetical protein